MDREKLIKQLFVGKVSEIIGTKKTTELLKESTSAIDEMLKSRQSDVSGSVCNYCKGNGKIFHWEFGQFVKCGVCQQTDR